MDHSPSNTLLFELKGEHRVIKTNLGEPKVLKSSFDCSKRPEFPAGSGLNPALDHLF